MTGKWALGGLGFGLLACGVVADFGTNRSLFPAVGFYLCAGAVLLATMIWAWPGKERR